MKRISEVDFSKYDGTRLDRRLAAENPNNKCEGAIELIPMDYRINAGINIDVECEFN